MEPRKNTAMMTGTLFLPTSEGKTTADNNRKEDARLLYMMELASSRLPWSGCFATIYNGNRDDFFARDVRRNFTASF